MITLDINEPSLSKRWFGYKTECGLLARFALLVNYKCRDYGGVKAFIYATNECFEGDVRDVLANINKTLESEFKHQLKEVPPPKDRGFFTQPWQGEARSAASGELFYIPPWQRESYTPPWKR